MQEAALHVPKEDLVKDDGADKVILDLDKLYLKDETLRKFHALDKLANFKHPSTMSMHQFLLDFDNLVDTTKTHGIMWANKNQNTMNILRKPPSISLNITKLKVN